MLIISGWRGAGKTTLCQLLVDAARERGWQAAGLLSPANIVDGCKTAINVEDLRTGERRQLAYSAALSAVQKAEIRTDSWIFDPDALLWGNAVMEKAVPCDLLVVDELGTLEMERGGGWQAGLQALDSGKYHYGIAIIRPELLEKAQARWPHAETVTINSASDAPAKAETLIKRLFLGFA